MGEEGCCEGYEDEEWLDEVAEGAIGGEVLGSESDAGG